MTYEEFLTRFDEDVHAEWVNGEAIIFIPGTLVHQVMLGFLLTLLSGYVRFFRLGEVLLAPFEVKLSPEGSSREPDILYVAAKHQDRLTHWRLIGPADLIVEIISDESVGRDRGDKFYEYQAAGVREYWIIDPRPGKERADFWVLDESGKYQPVQFDNDGIFRSQAVPGFWLREEWLTSAPLPDPLLVFAEIAGLPAVVVDALRQLGAPTQSPSGGQ
jgi:Uma2 family endonuclease